jgi:hypothetical protein
MLTAMLLGTGSFLNKILVNCETYDFLSCILDTVDGMVRCCTLNLVDRTGTVPFILSVRVVRCLTVRPSQSSFLSVFRIRFDFYADSDTDPDPAFSVNTDPDPGFGNQKLKKIYSWEKNLMLF